MYQSEFPVDQPIPIFDPTLLMGLILAAIVIAALAFAAGRLLGRKDNSERYRDVAKTIHEAIKAKCVAATSAPSGELVSKAHELVEEVDRRIGAVIKFGGPCAKAMKGLTEALKGEPAEEKKDKGKDAHAHGHGHGGGHGHGPGGGDHGGHGTGGHPGHGGHDVTCQCDRCVVAVVEAAAPNVTILGPRIGGQTVVISNPAKPADDHHGQHDAKVLDHKDFSKQVRMAVVEFSDFWSRGDCIVELERCQTMLTSTAPFPDLKTLRLKAQARH
ncbi:hypothetical protein [Caulobacter sp. DWR1-3-2b1]|uniref:hypothetical protein n=1 Tax=Caulobacter sp. DWR1-3-2b1 TaxID=2804670 RepID=UPI003CF88A77